MSRTCLFVFISPPAPLREREGSKRARIGSADERDVHRIQSKGETMNTQTVYKQSSEDYQRIEQAILYLENHYKEQPNLEEVAASIGLSEFHFQRLFTRWAGVSPKRFLQFLTKEGAKELLSRSENLLDTTHQVGLSSLGRLHDLFVSTEAVTPGEYKTQGEGVTIRYGIHLTPFGKCLIGMTERGICHLGFVQTSEGAALDDLVANWKEARMIEDYRTTAALVGPIFDLQFSTRIKPLTLH